MIRKEKKNKLKSYTYSNNVLKMSDVDTFPIINEFTGMDQ